MDKNSKIYIAGHTGLVGSAIWNNLISKGYTNLIGKTHSELDLTDQVAVKRFFDEEKPNAVILAAACVGGIMANSLYRADFIMLNMKIQCNVISEAYAHNVEKLLFLGSTCIYPKNAPQPLIEDCLLTSDLEYTNEEYAIAKIAGLKMCESYNLQYGTNYIAVMPTNLYGPNDNFHLENSHVMPAMMRKIYISKLLADNNWDAITKDLNIRPIKYKQNIINGYSDKNIILEALKIFGIETNKVTLWGTGEPLREFLWSEDMADAAVYLLLNINFSDIIGIEKYSSMHYEYSDRGGAIRDLGEIKNCHINIGTGKEITIKDLATLISKTINYSGTIIFDSSKPDGTMRKITNVDKLHALGWKHSIDIEEGVNKLYNWYKNSIR